MLALPLQDVPELIEGLRSESLAEREGAMKKLKAEGKRAIPALEKAAKDRDLDLALRAKQLLRVLDLLDRIPAPLMKERPGIEDRLALAGDHAWTLEYLDVMEAQPSA